MVKKDLNAELNVPEGITVNVIGASFTIKGPKGEVKRQFDSPHVKTELKDRTILLSSIAASKKEKAIMFSYISHIRNAFDGVTEPFVFKLKICSGHFPMNVSIANNMVSIKNFLGEKVPRQVKLKQGVSVKLDGTIIVVEGSNKEIAGQVAADIEQATRRPGFDRRIFQDGIYIIEKAGKKI